MTNVHKKIRASLGRHSSGSEVPDSKGGKDGKDKDGKDSKDKEKDKLTKEQQNAASARKTAFNTKRVFALGKDTKSLKNAPTSGNLDVELGAILGGNGSNTQGHPNFTSSHPSIAIAMPVAGAKPGAKPGAAGAGGDGEYVPQSRKSELAVAFGIPSNDALLELTPLSL